LRELARQLKYTASYLSKVERDVLVPGEDVLLGYARRLALDSDEVLARAHRLPRDVAAILMQRPGLLRLIREQANGAGNVGRSEDKHREKCGLNTTHF
jgi:transcriptional regulator with XRE-family HTH domain